MVARLDWDRFAWAGAMTLAAAMVGVMAGYDPRIAIAVALSAAFVLIAFENLASGLALFGFLAFIELVPVTSPALSAVKILGLLLALSWFAVLTTGRVGRLDFFTVHPFVSTALGLFLGWALLSMLWAENPSTALATTTRYALNLLLFVIVFTAIRTTKDLGRVLLGFMLGAAVAAIFGIASPAGGEAAGRLGSDLLDPNELAAVLVSGTALAVGVVALYRGAPLVRITAAATGVFCAIGVWLTASRGGLIALGVVLVLAIVLAGRWRPQMALAAVVFTAASYVYFSAFAPAEVQERITEPTQGQARIQEGRTTIWQVALRAFEANPAEGVGAGNFQTSSKHYLLEPGALARSDEIIAEPKVVHNTFLGVLAELGAVGFALFMLVVGFSVGSMLIAARTFGRAGDRRMQGAAICVAVALLGNLAASFFFSAEHSKQLWLLLGLGPALLSLSKATDGSAAHADVS